MKSFLKLGILGKQIGYTQSPYIHEKLLVERNLAASYQVFDVDEVNLSECLQRCWDAGFLGLNVTRPYKNTVASLVGAEGSSVNTLYRGVGFWRGASTDGVGFVRAVKRVSGSVATQAWSWKTVIVLGSGGVVPALLSCFREGQTVKILRRNGSNDEELRKLCPTAHFAELNLESLRICLLADPSSLIIQATSAPLHGEDLAFLAPALDVGAACVVDLVYGTPSRLYSRAKELGILCQDGLPMLEEQARESQRYWLE